MITFSQSVEYLRQKLLAEFTTMDILDDALHKIVHRIFTYIRNIRISEAFVTRCLVVVLHHHGTELNTLRSTWQATCDE